MSNDDTEGKRLWENIVREYALKALEAQERLDDEGADGYTSTETHKHLARVAVSYHRALKEYRDEAVVDDDDLPDIAFLRSRLGQTVKRTSPTAGRGASSTVETAPAVTEVPVEKIDATIDQLHEFRHKLGMKGGVKGNTEHNDVGHDDLQKLLEARGQDEAAERVPGGSD